MCEKVVFLLVCDNNDCNKNSLGGVTAPYSRDNQVCKTIRGHLTLVESSIIWWGCTMCVECAVTYPRIWSLIHIPTWRRPREIFEIFEKIYFRIFKIKLFKFSLFQQRIIFGQPVVLSLRYAVHWSAPVNEPTACVIINHGIQHPLWRREGIRLLPPFSSGPKPARFWKRGNKLISHYHLTFSYHLDEDRVIHTNERYRCRSSHWRA